MLAIARALMFAARLLLLDEPSWVWRRWSRVRFSVPSGTKSPRWPHGAAGRANAFRRCVWRTAVMFW